MGLHLDFTDRANEDVDFHKKSGNKITLKKIQTLLIEIIDHPKTGTGKPEQLKHNLSGLWSRRLNKEHRIIYEIQEDSIVIHSLKGHY